MTIDPPATAASVANRAQPMEASLWAEIRRMASIVMRSRERNHFFLLAAGLIVVVAATAFMQIQLNA